MSIWCLLQWNVAGGLKLYVYIENHIETFDPSNSRYWVKAKCRNFYSDKEQVDVTKITNTMCKLKANWSTVSVTCRFFLIFSEHIEFYDNILTLQLVLRTKYLQFHSKCLIYITVLHSVVTRNITFHNNQSTSVPISVKIVDINEHNSATGILWRIAGQ